MDADRDGPGWPRLTAWLAEHGRHDPAPYLDLFEGGGRAFDDWQTISENECSLRRVLANERFVDL